MGVAGSDRIAHRTDQPQPNSTHTTHPPPKQHKTQKSVLYLATDKGADKGVEPDGFATLQTHAGASGAQALKHVPVDVKVRS